MEISVVFLIISLFCGTINAQGIQNGFTFPGQNQFQRPGFPGQGFGAQGFPGQGFQQNGLGMQQNGLGFQNGFQQNGFQQNGFQQNGFQQPGFQQFPQSGFQNGFQPGMQTGFQNGMNQIGMGGIPGQFNPNACQTRGCQAGQQCVYMNGVTPSQYMCPTWIPILRCQCMTGCRAQNQMFISRGQSRPVDRCGNVCTCNSPDGQASCTMNACPQQGPVAQVGKKK